MVPLSGDGVARPGAAPAPGEEAQAAEVRLDVSSIEQQQRDDDHLDEVIASLQPRGASLLVQLPGDAFRGSFNEDKKNRRESQGTSQKAQPATTSALVRRRLVLCLVALIGILLLAASAFLCWRLLLEGRASSPSSSVSASALTSAAEDAAAVSE